MRFGKPSLDRIAIVAMGVLLPNLPACAHGPFAKRERDCGPPPLGPVMTVATASRSERPPEIPMLASPTAEPTVPMQPLPLAAEEATSPPDVGPALIRIDPSGPWTPLERGRTDSVLVEAIRLYASGATDQAMQRLQELDQPSRDMMVALMPIVGRLSNGTLKATDPQDLSALVAQIQKFIEPLRERAALEVPKLCFCKPLVAPARYGVYDRIEENHLFRAGEVVGLYVEVRNFTCAPHGKDYRVHVQTEIEVHDEKGEVVWRFDSPARTDPSLSPRQDYCHVGRFSLPGNMPAGAYTLWLKVTDVPTGRTARRALDFRVTKLPGGRQG